MTIALKIYIMHYSTRCEKSITFYLFFERYLCRFFPAFLITVEKIIILEYIKILSITIDLEIFC
jgi:hypothetical protein